MIGKLLSHPGRLLAGPRISLPALAPEIYKVIWRVVSANEGRLCPRISKQPLWAMQARVGWLHRCGHWRPKPGRGHRP